MIRRSSDERKRKLQEIFAAMDLSTILNFKGGVCKTTLITHIAAYMASCGKKVLLFDCDMQANSTMTFLGKIPKPTLTDVLRDQATLDDVIRLVRPNLWIVPSDVHLDSASYYIADDLKKIRHLIEDFLLTGGILLPETANRVLPDAILFDTASLTSVSKGALLASKDMIIPLEYEFFSIAGMATLMEKVGGELTKLDHEIDIRAIIPVKVNESRKITRDYYASLRNDPDLGSYLYPPLHMDVKVPESQAATQTVFEFMPERRSAKELTHIAQIYMGQKKLEDYLQEQNQLDGSESQSEEGKGV